MLRPLPRLLVVFAVLCAIASPLEEVAARGARSGSSFSSPSRSFSAPSRSPSAPSRSSSSGSSSSFSRPDPSSSRPSNPPPSSSADNAFSSKVNRAGTSSSRGDYTASRQAEAARQSSANRPTQFDSEPASRPPYIPQGQVLPNGRYAPIYYDSGHRGYGFWDDFGKWIILDSILNHNRGGYAQQPMQGSSYPVQNYPNNYPAQPGTVYTTHSSGSPVFGFLVIIVIVGGCVWLYMRHTNKQVSPLTGSSGTDPDFGGSNSINPRTSMPKAKPTNLDSWINLSPGAFITLSDQQALQDSKDRGEGLKGIDYKVESLALAKDSEGFGSWVLIHLNDGHQKLLLMVKGVDEQIDHRIYYESPEFRPDRREDIIARGDTWLFDNADNASPNAAGSLRYAAEINYATNGAEVRYILKQQGERQASYSEKPGLSGANNLIATIVEYSTGDPTDNPEMLVLEIGAESRRTGEVSLYFGCAANPSELDIVKA